MHGPTSSEIFLFKLQKFNFLITITYYNLFSDFTTINDGNMTMILFYLTELAYTMEVNEKCDVYSFRLLTLEILMGKHPREFISYLSSSAFTTLNMPLKDVLDQQLSLPLNQAAMEVLSIAKIAISCLHTVPQSRPTMQQVSQELSTQKPHFPSTLHMITLGEIVDL